jgi:activator of HSP90 ATPase
MPTSVVSRRALALRLAALPAGLVLATRSWSAPAGMESSKSADGDGLTHTSEAIHQEIHFDASRERVYRALTSSDEFDAVTRLSDAITLVTATGAKPTSIGREVGASFTLFGGYITGRNLELHRNERLVQAWRTGAWNVGDYSVVKFVLVADGVGTKLVFDHRGFPEGEGGHLAEGWHTHYWDPLRKFLSQR